MLTPSEYHIPDQHALVQFLTFVLSLIAKWKKTGYEKLCCLRCIQTRVRLLPSWPGVH